MSQKHDKYIKSVLNSPKQAIEFVNEFLPQKVLQCLDLNSVKRLKNSYINEQLKESFSDVVLQFKLKESKRDCKVCVLIEHKSYNDPFAYIQILDYLSSAYRAQTQQKKEMELIVPVLYYHGRAKWTAKTFAEIFSHYPDELQKYVPNYEHIAVKVNTFSLEDLENIDSFSWSLIVHYQFYMKHPKMLDIMKAVFQKLEKKRFNKQEFKVFLIYFYQTTLIEDKKVIRIFENNSEKLKEVAMTTYQQIVEKGKAEGIAEGKAEGLVEGISKAKMEIVINGFDNKLNISLIANITSLDEDQVKSILKEHGRI